MCWVIKKNNIKNVDLKSADRVVQSTGGGVVQSTGGGVVKGALRKFQS